MLEKLGQEKNYLSSIIFVMVLVGYPIFSGITIALGIESNALSIMYRLIVLTAAIALLLKSCLRYRLKINLGIFIGSSFLFYYVARMFLEWIFNSAGVKIDWLDFWSFLILVCLVPALPYAWGENIPNSSFTPFAIIVLGIIGLVFNFYFIFRVGDSSLGDQLFSGRVESERLNPIAYGHLGVSTVLMSLWMILLKKNINILAIFGFFFRYIRCGSQWLTGPNSFVNGMHGINISEVETPCN